MFRWMPCGRSTMLANAACDPDWLATVRSEVIHMVDSVPNLGVSEKWGSIKMHPYL